MEAVKGTEKTIIHQGKKHQVKIPAGANDGTRIQFNEFIVSLNVSPHPTFKRDGYDIFTDINITFTQAALGGQIKVPTIEKEITLKVRPGTQPNTMIRLKNRGIPHLRDSGKGDHYIRLIVNIPKHLSKKQRQLLKEFQHISS